MAAPPRRLAPFAPPVLAQDVPLSDAEFERIRDLVYRHTGIALAPHKRSLVQARLARRLRALGLTSFMAYHRHLTTADPGGKELVRFINAMTTNKTDFFREAHHFRFLEEEWAPARLARSRRETDRVVRFWSAGCSTGEEPWSLAITLHHALPLQAGGWDLKILASDIDTDVLASAEEGIYKREQVVPVPEPLLRRYFLRGTGEREGTVAVGPEVRPLVVFRRINLLDDALPVRARFDGIFCRNVLIYFDRPTQARVLERLLGFLKDDGFLFLGHSEGALGLMAGLAPVGATVYRRAQ